jgi:hypothetical protein
MAINNRETRDYCNVFNFTKQAVSQMNRDICKNILNTEKQSICIDSEILSEATYKKDTSICL